MLQTHVGLAAPVHRHRAWDDPDSSGAAMLLLFLVLVLLGAFVRSDGERGP
jgi:hypothetical protein